MNYKVCITIKDVKKKERSHYSFRSQRAIFGSFNRDSNILASMQRGGRYDKRIPPPSQPFPASRLFSAVAVGTAVFI